MEFGKFLFIYLLGRNVEFFAYKRILDLIVELDQEDQPYINEEPSKRGSNLQRQLSKSNVKDVSTNELYGPLPQAPPQIPEHENSYEMTSTLPKYTYQDKDLQQPEDEKKTSSLDWSAQHQTIQTILFICWFEESINMEYTKLWANCDSNWPLE